VRTLHTLGRLAARAAAAAVMLSLVACGGGGGGGNVTGGTPPPVQRQPARLTATFANATWDLSPRVDFNYRLAFDLTVRESAGTGARLNFLRADFRDGSGRFLERQEAGSNVLNAIAANGTLADRITIDFNDGNTSSALITISAIDQLGNVVEMTMTILCCG
jgi:hypothetical protein